jgi:hypothetical protein
MILVEPLQRFLLSPENGSERGRNIYYETLKCKHKKAVPQYRLIYGVN